MVPICFAGHLRSQWQSEPAQSILILCRVDNSILIKKHIKRIKKADRLNLHGYHLYISIYLRP